MKRLLIRLFSCVLLLMVPGTIVFAQAGLSRGSNASTEPVLYWYLEYEYQKSERKTEETNLNDVHQYKTIQRAKSELFYYFIGLSGEYREYLSGIKIDDEKAEVKEIRYDIMGQIFLPFNLYLTAFHRQTISEYEYDQEGSTNFKVNESTGITSGQGLGLQLGEWRFEYYQNNVLNWGFEVDVLGTSTVDENIQLTLATYSIARIMQDKQGFFFDFRLEQSRSVGEEDGRDGDYNGLTQNYLAGIGFGENSQLFVGYKKTTSLLESTLEADNSALEKDLDTTELFYGIQIAYSEDKAIYLIKNENVYKVDHTNVSYDNTAKLTESELTFGVEVSRNIILEIKTGKIIDKRSFDEKSVTNQQYEYKQEDDVVGAALRFQFIY